ncbi:hypothetical protein ACHAW6_013769 [Cyclotella cf. meneghiniana]
MIHNIWLNLPSKNLEKTRVFYEALGFAYNENSSHAGMVSFTAPGKVNIVVCFFPPEVIAKFSGNSVTETDTSNEVLISLGANSKEDVDAIAKVVQEGDTGGKLYSEPIEVDGEPFYVMKAIEGHSTTVTQVFQSWYDRVPGRRQSSIV